MSATARSIDGADVVDRRRRTARRAACSRSRLRRIRGSSGTLRLEAVGVEVDRVQHAVRLAQRLDHHHGRAVRLALLEVGPEVGLALRPVLRSRADRTRWPRAPVLGHVEQALVGEVDVAHRLDPQHAVAGLPPGSRASCRAPRAPRTSTTIESSSAIPASRSASRWRNSRQAVSTASSHRRSSSSLMLDPHSGSPPRSLQSESRDDHRHRGSGYRSPTPRASQVAAWVRFSRPSLVRMRLTWLRAVMGEMNSWSAI